MENKEVNYRITLMNVRYSKEIMILDIKTQMLKDRIKKNNK